MIAGIKNVDLKPHLRSLDFNAISTLTKFEALNCINSIRDAVYLLVGVWAFDLCIFCPFQLDLNIYARAWSDLRVKRESEVFVDEETDPIESMKLIGGTEFRKAVLDDRDAALASHCESMMDDWKGYRVAVVWGGGHIPQLIEFLEKEHGYHVENIEWMTVIAK